MTIKQSIHAGLTALGLPLAEPGIELLSAYLSLLERWNRTYNLTAVRDPQQMVSRHILDSLAIQPWLCGAQVLDVGSGAGLPGIPLAIAQPDCTFHLLDSNGKRTRFLTQVVAELELKNVAVVRTRIEDYQPSCQFNSIVSRAFASIADFLASSGRLCAANGRILAMKGAVPEDELAHLAPSYALAGVHTLRIPGLDAERCLVHLHPIAPT